MTLVWDPVPLVEFKGSATTGLELTDLKEVEPEVEDLGGPEELVMWCLVSTGVLVVGVLADSMAGFFDPLSTEVLAWRLPSGSLVPSRPLRSPCLSLAATASDIVNLIVQVVGKSIYRWRWIKVNSYRLESVNCVCTKMGKNRENRRWDNLYDEVKNDHKALFKYITQPLLGHPFIRSYPKCWGWSVKSYYVYLVQKRRLSGRL